MNGISTRLAAASGAFYVAAIIVGNVLELSGSGAGTDGSSELAFLQRDLSVVNVSGFVLATLGFAAFVVFLGYLHSALRRAEGADGWVASAALGAGLLSLAVKVGSISAIVAGTYRKDELTPDLARTLVDLNGAAFVVFGLSFGLFVTISSAGCLAYRMSARWLGWSGVVIGSLAFVAGVAGLIAPDRYNPLAFVGSLAWTLVLSVVLTVRGRPAEKPGRSRTTALGADVAGAV
jgi:hypothetical protein